MRPEPNTIALGGVATGSIKAQLAAKTTGKITVTTFISEFIAKVPSNGKSKKVVAVLLVNSVNKDVKKVRMKIIKSKLN